MNNIKLIGLIGESGSGKDSIMRVINDCNVGSKFYKIVEFTTRPPREGEVDGKDYYFITDKKFEEMREAGDILVDSEYRGWHYAIGTQSFNTKKPNIAILNPAFVKALSSIPDIDLHLIKIQATERTRLMRSLNREFNVDVDEVIRRLLADRQDFEDLKRFLLYKEINCITVDNESDETFYSSVGEVLDIINQCT